MKWRCYNRYLWFEIKRNLSPPDAFYGIFYVENPFAVGAPPRTLLGERASSLAPRLDHAFTPRQYRQAQHPYLKIPSYGPGSKAIRLSCHPILF